MYIAHKKKLDLVDLSLGEYSQGYGIDSPSKQIYFWSFIQTNRNSKSLDLLWHLHRRYIYEKPHDRD
jgi:hypothetical protein